MAPMGEVVAEARCDDKRSVGGMSRHGESVGRKTKEED